MTAATGAIMYHRTTGSAHRQWTGLTGRLEYCVRVRGTVFLWGSDSVTVNATFDPPPLFTIRNDVLGEKVTFGTQAASGAKVTIGTLKPGECFSLPLQNIVGVFATCDLESDVDCVIKP